MVFGGDFIVTFQNNLGNTNVNQLTSTPGPNQIIIRTDIEGGGGKVVNGTSGGPGIYRIDQGAAQAQWFNMTGVVSFNRASVPTTKAVANTADANPLGTDPPYPTG